MARLDKDFGEAIGEAGKRSAGSAKGQGTTEHFEHMVSEEQGVDDAVEAGAKRGAGGLGLGNQMAGLGARQVKLATEIGVGHLDIAHGHVGRSVAE